MIREARALVATSVVVAVGWLPGGCTTSRTAATNGSLDAGPRTSFPDAGTLTNPVVRCADAPCEEPPGSGVLGARACCIDEDRCGLRAPALRDACLPRGNPGSVDLSCPVRSLRDGTFLQGCCTPRGECGLFDRFADLGCVPPEPAATADSGDGASDASVACRFDPEATCRSVVELPCDGPEDCGEGRACCGRLSHDSYDRFACFASCSDQASSTGELWLEVCHPGEPCADPSLACENAPPLPAFLGRCYANRPPLPEAGTLPDGSPPRDAAVDPTPNADASRLPHPGVACGAVTCGDKCCLADPGEPYCAENGARCACAPTAAARD
ncbi:MAG TPA: hypothetical protein VHE30_19110 [Polyangiaceae bacterium]|nr:hypothetical protein [Polyangiaceae bacterium]